MLGASRNSRLYRPRANRTSLMHGDRINRPSPDQLAGCGPGDPHADLGPGRLRLPFHGIGPGTRSELFAGEPRTPIELWDAVDYLPEPIRPRRPCRTLTGS